MILEFELYYQTISFINKGVKIVANSKNYLKAHFNTKSDDWQRPITAIFKSGDDIYNVLLDDNDECLVPWEVLENVDSVSVSAFSGDLHTANKVVFNVTESGYEEGKTPGEPTPDVYQQLIILSEQTKFIVEELEKRANSGEFDGKDGSDYILTEEDKEEIAGMVEGGGTTGEIILSDTVTGKKYTLSVVNGKLTMEGVK